MPPKKNQEPKKTPVKGSSGLNKGFKHPSTTSGKSVSPEQSPKKSPPIDKRSKVIKKTDIEQISQKPLKLSKAFRGRVIAFYNSLIEEGALPSTLTIQYCSDHGLGPYLGGNSRLEACKTQVSTLLQNLRLDGDQSMQEEEEDEGVFEEELKISANKLFKPIFCTTQEEAAKDGKICFTTVEKISKYLPKPVAKQTTDEKVAVIERFLELYPTIGNALSDANQLRKLMNVMNEQQRLLKQCDQSQKFFSQKLDNLGMEVSEIDDDVKDTLVQYQGNINGLFHNQFTLDEQFQKLQLRTDSLDEKIALIDQLNAKIGGYAQLEERVNNMNMAQLEEKMNGYAQLDEKVNNFSTSHDTFKATLFKQLTQQDSDFQKEIEGVKAATTEKFVAIDKTLTQHGTQINDAQASYKELSVKMDQSDVNLRSFFDNKMDDQFQKLQSLLLGNKQTQHVPDMTGCSTPPRKECEQTEALQVPPFVLFAPPHQANTSRWAGLFGTPH